MRRQTSVIFYALTAYVLLQFGWWGFHLIDLTQELNNDPEHLSKRALMILGEGTVFFIIVFFGLWKIQSSIKKELELSAKQQNFVLSITHELKTPIAAVKLYLQTLGKRSLQEEKRDEILRKALLENSRLEHMIENVLTVARIENQAFRFHPEPVTISETIEEVTSSVCAFDTCKVSIDCPKDLVYKTDKFALHTILSNLTENALKYAGKDCEITIHCQLSEGRLHLDFSDNGPGVPEEKLKSIFQRFLRLENEETRNSKGAGLGLYIVNQFVLGQGGTISVKNKKTSGLLFSISL